MDDNHQQVKAMPLILRMTSASHKVRNLSLHSVLCIYYWEAVLYARAAYAALFPPLFNILAQYRRVSLRLHIQVESLHCSPGQLGKEEVKGKRKEKKKGGDDGKKAHNNSLFPCMLGPAA